VHASHFAVRLSLVPIALALSATSAGATTLIRQGLDQLTKGSETIVQATILDIHSYWNADHYFILTDLRMRPSRILKGDAADDVICTVMGGSVGDVTTLIVGGADLAPGSEYVLFLAHADLPGAANRLTIRDHSQGVFEIVGGRAFSQAIGEPLLPDEGGMIDVPGGAGGLDLDELIDQVHSYSNR
jgi:hypothetical protein